MIIMAKVVKKNMELKYVVRRAVAKGIIALAIGCFAVVGMGIVGGQEYEYLNTIEVFELDGKTEQRVHLEKGDYIVTPSGKIKADEDMDIIVSEKGKYRIVD